MGSVIGRHFKHANHKKKHPRMRDAIWYDPTVCYLVCVAGTNTARVVSDPIPAWI